MSFEKLRELQRQKLSSGLVRVFASNAFYRRRMDAAGISPDSIRDWDDWSRFPFTRKEDLLHDQAEHPPYGSNLTAPLSAYVRMHQTTGTSGRRLRWADTAAGWNWITDELWPANFSAIGLRTDDRLFFPFSFGPFLGFWAAFEGAARLGRFVLAGGGMTSAARLQLIADHSITVVFCTPTYALRLAEVAAEERFDLAGSTVRAVVLAGEPGGNVPATRARIEAAWGARAFDHSGMTEIGALGIEYEDVPGRLYLLEDHCIAEFINPADGTPAPEGELAELVLTNLGRWDSPLLRYRTGDLVRWRRDVKPAGAPWPYVSLEGGILARADDMLWVKGNNVYPSAIEEVLRGIAEVAEYRLEVRGPQAAADLTITVEPAPGAEADPLLERVARAVQDRLYFRPAVKAATAGSLPRFEMKAQRVVRIDG